MTYVRLKHPPGEKVKLTILRGNKRQDVLLQLE